MNIVVYHGSASVVDKPLCVAARPNLDFGQGFYVTDIHTGYILINIDTGEPLTPKSQEGGLIC